MEAILSYLQQNIDVAPYIIPLLLLAAGGNIPISEDLITITAGLMAALQPQYAPQLLVSLLAGAFLGDAVSYWFGRGAGHLLLRSGESGRKQAFRLKVATMKEFLSRRTVFVLIAGRYIPFGFRNILHMTAGITRIPFKRYMVIDFPAVFLTTGLLFSLVYWFGSRAADIMGTARIVFMLFLTVSATAYVIWRRTWMRNK